jgi:hypothetical protein
MLQMLSELARSIIAVAKASSLVHGDCVSLGSVLKISA